MSGKNDALRKRAEKNKARALEYARLAKADEKALSEKERDDDTRRKIIDGAHMQTRALTNPDVAAMLQQDREKLVSDIDRKLFGLPVLTDTEKMARGIPLTGKPGRKPKSQSADTIALPPPSATLEATGAPVQSEESQAA